MYRLYNSLVWCLHDSTEIHDTVVCKKPPEIFKTNLNYFKLRFSPPCDWELVLSLQTGLYICTWKMRVIWVCNVPCHLRPWNLDIAFSTIKYSGTAMWERQVTNNILIWTTFSKVKLVWNHYGLPKIKLGRHYQGVSPASMH